MIYRVLRELLRGLNEIMYIRYLQYLYGKQTVNIKYCYNCFDKSCWFYYDFFRIVLSDDLFLCLLFQVRCKFFEDRCYVIFIFVMSVFNMMFCIKQGFRNIL